MFIFGGKEGDVWVTPSDQDDVVHSSEVQTKLLWWTHDLTKGEVIRLKDIIGHWTTG